jgi:hypothetical protein
MSEAGDRRNTSAGGNPAHNGPDETRPSETDSATAPAAPGQLLPQVTPLREQPLEFENLQLLSRLVIGFLFLGGDELMKRLRFLQQQIDAEPRLSAAGVRPEEESSLDFMRYLAVGLFVRGEKTVARGVQVGIRLTVGTAGRLLGGLNRLTDNRIIRPLRRPAEAHLRDWGDEALQIINEGRHEEQDSRLLAGRTAADVIDEVLAYVIEDPELYRVLTAAVGEQGAGLANLVTDNARSAGASSDSAVERVVRRFLRRTPRGQLPPSPLHGEPQTMYMPERRARQGGDHDR